MAAKIRDRSSGWAGGSSAVGSPASFSPEQIAEVKAVACEPPAREGVPLSRRSRADVHRLVIERGVTRRVCVDDRAVVARGRDPPVAVRSWIFPTDPEFAVKAGRILDLYQGRWEGELLHPARGDLARMRSPRSRPRPSARPARPRRAARRASRAHLRARRRADLFRGVGRAPRAGDRPLRTEGRDRPVRSARRAGHDPRAIRAARRVFWIVDNGSSHRGERSVDGCRASGRNSCWCIPLGGRSHAIPGAIAARAPAPSQITNAYQTVAVRSGAFCHSKSDVVDRT